MTNLVCGSFVCIYRSQCVAFEVLGTDACFGATGTVNHECVICACQSCVDTYCSSFLPKAYADDSEVPL